MQRHPARARPHYVHGASTPFAAASACSARPCASAFATSAARLAAAAPCICPPHAYAHAMHMPTRSSSRARALRPGPSASTHPARTRPALPLARPPLAGTRLPRARHTPHGSSPQPRIAVSAAESPPVHRPLPRAEACGGGEGLGVAELGTRARVWCGGARGGAQAGGEQVGVCEGEAPTP
jgi:hypothetical protein